MPAIIAKSKTLTTLNSSEDLEQQELILCSWEGKMYNTLKDSLSVLFFLRFYLFIWETACTRETARENMSRGEGQSEREKQIYRGAGSPMQDSIPWPRDHDPSWRQTLKWLSHPDAPVQQFLTKLDILLLYDPAVVLLGIYSSELKTYVHT